MTMNEYNWGVLTGFFGFNTLAWFVLWFSRVDYSLYYALGFFVGSIFAVYMAEREEHRHQAEKSIVQTLQ